MSVIKKYKKPLIATAAVVVGYLVYKTIKNRQPSQGAALLNDEAAAKAKGQSLSYTQATYVNLANVIFNAWFQNFNIFNPVDEKQILSVMSKMKNDLDIIALTRAFGKRRAPVPFGSFFVSDLSLGEWLREGLYENEIQAVNNVLKAKGITAQF
ncbi:MAG: hypothetical protein WCG15_00320 [Actinomycetes bacterium]|jgi:hypothetical protein